jgi:hypothetical protein
VIYDPPLHTMTKSTTTKQRPTLEQLKIELLSVKEALKKKLEDLKAELSGLRADLREEE